MRSLLFALLLTPAAAASARGQVRADPGTVINGRVAVRVYVVLSDDHAPYVPIRDVQLRFFRTTADTNVAVRTDDAGSATALLAPGEYRLLTSSPVTWNGARYAWNRLVQVKPGLGAIELTAASAERTEVARGVAGIGPPPQSGTDGTRLVRRDPGLATLYSFFAPGSGHLYAGERTKGATLLGVSLVGLVVGVNAMSCAASADCDPSPTEMTAGAVGMLAFLGSWGYGVLDADDAARRFNDRNGLTVSAIRPVIAPAARGGVRLGLRLAVGR